jgi:hypothetical protein
MVVKMYVYPKKQRRIATFRQTVPLSARLFHLQSLLTRTSTIPSGPDDQGEIWVIESQVAAMSTRLSSASGAGLRELLSRYSEHLACLILLPLLRDDV